MGRDGDFIKMVIMDKVLSFVSWSYSRAFPELDHRRHLTYLPLGALCHIPSSFSWLRKRTRKKAREIFWIIISYSVENPKHAVVLIHTHDHELCYPPVTRLLPGAQLLPFNDTCHSLIDVSTSKFFFFSSRNLIILVWIVFFLPKFICWTSHPH